MNIIARWSLWKLIRMRSQFHMFYHWYTSTNKNVICDPFLNLIFAVICVNISYALPLLILHGTILAFYSTEQYKRRLKFKSAFNGQLKLNHLRKEMNEWRL